MTLIRLLPLIFGLPLLMLLLAPPTGASPGVLDSGVLATDVAFVSPDLTLAPSDREVEVTLTNSGLDVTDTVEDGGTFEELTVTIVGDKLAGDSFRIFIDSISGIGADVTLGSGTVTDVLPIISTASQVTIADETGFAEGAVTVSSIINATSGAMLFFTNQPLTGGDTFTVSYETSPQETAMASVTGDSGGFDLLLVESPAGPPADYAGIFVVADEVILDIGHPGAAFNSIVGEQHDVLSGLQGNIAITDESITNKFNVGIPLVPWTGADPIPVNTPFYVQVANPPLRDIDGVGGLATTTSDVNLDLPIGVSVVSIVDAALGVVQLTTGGASTLPVADAVQLDYRGSDSFTVTLNHAPPQAAITTADLVVPSETDFPVNTPDVFAVISTDMATGAVRIGVVVGDSSAGIDPINLSGRITVLGVTYDGSERLTVPVNTAVNDTFNVTLDGAPEDANGGGITGADVSVRTDILTGSVGGSATAINGRVATFTVSGADAVAGETFTVAYAFQVGFDPRNALLPAQANRPIILVTADRRVTIRSANDVERVVSEDGPPDFTSELPADGTSTPLDADFPDISIDITDDLAGIDPDTITMSLTAGNTVDLVADDLTLTPIPGGFRASIDLDDISDEAGELNIPDDAETTITWWAAASDNASNAAQTDADPDTAGTFGAADPFSLEVDGVDPSIDGAFTGEWWDPIDETIQGDRNELAADNFQHDPELPAPTKGSINNSIRVLYSEPLDGSSILADGSQFTVTGHTVTAAQHFTDAAESVFLTTNPHLDSSEAPLVTQTGTILDVAGNELTSPAGVTPDDAIAPSATVVPDVTISSGEFVLTVNTNEDILRLAPDMEVFIANGPNQDETDSIDLAANVANTANLTITLTETPVLDFDGDGDVDAADLNLGALPTNVNFVSIDATTGVLALNNNTGGVLTAGTAFTVSYRGTDPDPAIMVNVPSGVLDAVVSNQWTYSFDVAESNVYSFVVTVEDENNTGSQGEQDPASTDAVTVEIDNDFAAASLTDPATDDTDTFADPFFIELSFRNEADEYLGDTSGFVRLTMAELDGVDVLNLSSTRDNRVFTVTILVDDFLAASGASDFLGDHTLVYNAEDALGNTLGTTEDPVNAELDFTVAERPSWDLGLAPGLNLVSLPADPADMDINTVFGATDTVNLVFTFDNEAGNFLVASRDPETGTFVGTLETIDAMHAYWIRAGATATVEVDIPPQGAQAGLPFISVVGGRWNLVPVISLDPLEDILQGVELDADDYLGAFRTAFTFDTGRWERIDPGQTPDDDPNTLRDAVQIGRGYWVWFDDDSTLTP